MQDTRKTPRSLIASFAMAALLCAALAVTLPAAAQPADAAGANAVGVATAQPLAERAAANYRAQARYPDHSRAVAPGGDDPVRARRTPAPHSLRPNADAPGITVWSSEVSYEHPAVVTLYATVDPAPGRSGKVDAAILGEVVTPAGVTVGTVDYRDDGEGADRRAGDGVHTGTFSVPAEHLPALAESFGVKVTAVMDGGETVGAIGGFLYGQPDAQLTGNYRDSVRGGNLVVEAEVEVTESGRFYLEGTVAPVQGGPGAAPVGWAQAAVELEPGSHWVELSFYGLMFHERGAAGPFRLSSVALSTTTGMPNALNDLVEDAHRTRAYPLAHFTRRPFANPGLLRAAERLERPAPQGHGQGNGGG